MECEFCKKVFKTKYSLSNHQKTTKNCLLLQGKIDDENILKYECNFCDKKFSRSDNLETHQLICKVKKQEEQESISKQLEEYKRIKEENNKLKNKLKQERQYEKEIDQYKLEINCLKEENKKNQDKFIEELLLTQEKNREEKQLLKDEILVLKTELKVKNEMKEDFDKKDDKCFNVIKEVVTKSNKTTNNTNNTVNNVYVQQQLDQLTPINDLPTLIANNPHLSSTLKTLTDINDFYYLCANESKKCLLVKDSSREIVSGRKLDENNNVEYISGKMQSIIGDHIVNEELFNKVRDEYKKLVDRITENSEEEINIDESDIGQNLLSLCGRVTKAKRNENKLEDEEILNIICKKAMTIIPKIKNK